MCKRIRKLKIRMNSLILSAMFFFLFVPFAYSGGGRNRVMGGELTIHPARGPIAVDGNLEEWDEAQAKLLTLFSGALDTGAEKPVYGAYRAKISLEYDSEALYAAIWWNRTGGTDVKSSAVGIPPGDGIILTLPGNPVKRLALWSESGIPGLSSQAKSILAVAGQLLEKGKSLAGTTQGFRRLNAESYTQEIRIPWSGIGGAPAGGAAWRMGVELCFQGFDPLAGYRACLADVALKGSTINRWGGNLGWGFVDGIRSADIVNPGFDTSNGAEVKCMPAGTAPTPNAPAMFMGNELTRTQQMVAVPAGKITVDGRMEDAEWDAKSATVIAYEPTLLPGHYSVEVHWAYGVNGLYAGLRWLTGGPHFNINDPSKIDRGYDGGDSVQIRLGIDRVTHIDTWYCDEKQQAAMRLAYGVRFDEGKEDDAIGKGARMAIAQTDGGGYTQEIFLPWALITKEGKALKEGDSFRVIMDLWFSGVEGNRIPFILNTRFAPSTAVVKAPLTAPENGYYTAVIDNEKGEGVRCLLTRASLRKGQSVVEWDGLDNDGKPAPAGAYRFRGLYHKGIGMSYQMTFNNPGTPPWANEDGTGDWGSDESPLQTVAGDDLGVYLGAPSAEMAYGIIGCDFSGRKRWGFFQTPYPSAGGGTALLASDGQFLYFGDEHWLPKEKGQKELGYCQSSITCFDRMTGQRRGFSVSKPFHVVGRHDTSQVKVGWLWDLLAKGDFSLDTYAFHDDYYFTGHCAGGNLSGLAARDGKIYASFRISGEIAVYSSKDMSELARWKLEKPAGLAFAKDGRLLAISGNSVVALDVKNGKAAPVVSSGLEAPVALASDAEGCIYVSDWGKAQCVKVFSPDGRLLRMIGTPGGRAWVGKFNPDGMLTPRGLTVDKEGKLWVAEDDNLIRRVSVWNRGSGKLIKDFIGPVWYGGMGGGGIDPGDSSRAVSNMVLYELDWKNRTYRPLSTLWRRTSLDDCFGLSGSFESPRIFRSGNRTFLLNGSSASAAVLGELDPKDLTWKALAAAGGIFNRGNNPQVMPLDKLPWRSPPWPELFKTHAGDNFIWSDLDRDGAMQENEMQWAKATKEFPLIGACWGTVGGFDNELNAIVTSNYVGEPNTANHALCFPLREVNKDGVPIYDINKTRAVVRFAANHGGQFMFDSKGNYYKIRNGEVRTPASATEIASYSQAGRLLWTYPTYLDSRPMGNVNGELFIGPVSAAAGEAGEFFGLTQWHGLHVPLITTDGLFMDRLLRDPAEGGLPGPDLWRSETMQNLSRLEDGRVILSHGANAHHLFEVTGLETVRRFQGEFTLTPEQARLATEQVEASRTRTKRTAPIVMIRRKDAPTIDGNLSDWDWSSAAGIGTGDQTPRAEFAVRTAEKTLYLAWKVMKGGPFLNKGEDATLLFVSGDSVELQYGSDPAADPKRKSPVMGDCRLLVSRLKEQPGSGGQSRTASGEQSRTVAILYRAKMLGASNPVPFRNPAGNQVLFDQVKELKDAKVAIVDTADGYVVEMSVPLSDLGLDWHDAIWPGRVIQADPGVIIGDATGNRVARLHRFNDSYQVLSDLPTEAALTPDLWGEIEVEKLDQERTR
ncbi:MAG: hypothetical protein WAX69_13125 [Victivallales bacterium]